jgi:uncharacterized coiled-coil protein SlyX
MQILQYFSIYVHNFELVIGAKLIIIFQLSAHLVLKNDSATQIFEPILALLFESDDFMIVLTRDELSRCQIGTLNIKRGHNIKYLPFAFTELGVAMLSSVLKSSSAIKVNRDIMRAFVALRHIVEMPNTDDRLKKLEVEIQNIKDEMNDTLADQNDINESTRMQLDAISTALAELQSEHRQQPKRKPIGFIQPEEKDED